MSGLLLARRMGGAKTGIALPAIGDAWLGGYFTGIIDTVKTPPIAADYYQSGQRHAVILAPKALESSKQYELTNASIGTVPAACTLWNGLGATAALNSVMQPAANYCANLTKPSGDKASAWYLPAIDELELVWRNLKPVTNNNTTNSYTGTFPPYSHASGVNPSSDPAGAGYTATIPGQTSVALFKAGGAQEMSGTVYWTATEASGTNGWMQVFNTSVYGRQAFASKTDTYYVRPVRRLVLS